MTVGVEAKNLWKTYPGDIHAVRGVDLRIEPGELMVLVGPSGCGKTTTLRMVAGLERISSGEIYVGEKLVNQVHPSKRGVALVFQNFALYPHKTAWQNMSFPLESQGVSKPEIDLRIAEVAEMLELSAHLHKRPDELSGGQQQRVSLGRAVVRNPSVLLLDEPLSNLDARLRVVMRTELKRIQRRVGSTAIYVTHDQVEAMTMGDRIVVMDAGQVGQIGTPQEVYLTPATLAVAQTIGSPAMNLLPGTAKISGGQVALEGPAWSLSIDGEGAKHLSQLLGSSESQEIVIGIRPENVDLGHGKQESSRSVVLGHGPCITAEPLGAETLYNVEIGKTLVRVVRRETHVSLNEAETADVLVTHGARLHLFDKASGKRLAGVVLQNDGTGLKWMPFTTADRLESDRLIGS